MCDSLTEVEAYCFQIAIDIFNNELAAKPGSKKHTKYHLDAQVTSHQDLVEAVQRAQEESSKRTGKLGQWAIRLSIFLKRHGKAIDVFVQAEPTIGILVWGTMRILILAAAEDSEVSEVCQDGLGDIADQLQLWKSYSNIATFQKLGPQQALTSLYVTILKFLTRARCYYRKQNVPGCCLLKSVLSNKADKFRGLLKDIRKNADMLVDVVLRENTEVLNDLMDANKRDKASQWLSSDLGSVSEMTHHPGTGQWVLDSEAFRRWETSRQGTLLIHGLPGSGKTTLLGLIYSRTLASRGADAVLRYSFQSSPDQRRANCAMFVASMLLQVLARTNGNGMSLLDETQRRILDRISPLASAHRSPLDCPWPELSSTLFEVLKGRMRYTIFIDALDEADYAEQQGFLRLFRELQVMADEGQLSLLVSSRPNAPIISDCPISVSPDFSIDLSKEPGVAEDVELFIRDKVSSHKRLRLFSDIIIPAVTREANGMFLWAHLTLKYLQDAHGKADCHHRLRSFPTNIGDAYAKMARPIIASLDLERRIQRADILRCLYVSQAPLSAESWYILIFQEPESKQLGKEVIFDLCQPFVAGFGDHLGLFHNSVREYLAHSRSSSIVSSDLITSKEDANASLAKHCLSLLSRDEYKDLDSIGILLRRSLMRSQEERLPDSEVLEETYRYAADYWMAHVVETTDPDDELVKLLAEFLQGPQFVYWGQYQWEREDTMRYPFLKTKAELDKWAKNLPSPRRDLLHLEAFFDGPYLRMSHVYKKKNTQFVLQWLCLIPVGRWYYHLMEISKRDDVRGKIVEGLTKTLGPEDPLTLSARVDDGYQYIDRRAFDVGLREFQDIAAVQARVIGEDAKDTNITLFWVGECQWYLTRFEESLETFGKAMDRIRKVATEDDYWFQTIQYWTGKALLSTDRLELARAVFESVHHKTTSLYGRDHIISIASEGWLGTLYLRLGNFKGAEEALAHAYSVRKELWGLGAWVTLDEAMQLLVLYWNFDFEEKESRLIKELKERGKFDQFPNRFVNFIHLCALKSYELGEKEEAVRSLEGALRQIEREEWDRDVYFAILTAVNIKREIGDEKEAAMLFEGIVKAMDGVESAEGDGDEGEEVYVEADSPKMLMLAEQAVRLVKDGKMEDATALLEENGLKWARKEDLWMGDNDPLPDMAKIREPGKREF